MTPATRAAARSGARRLLDPTLDGQVTTVREENHVTAEHHREQLPESIVDTHFLGPNSNTFAFTVARQCHVRPPHPVEAPGRNAAPPQP
jgi:hypothetical protein